MLQEIKLFGVGPSEQIGPINFSQRINFFFGDNGLGKSFILDAAWWALTRSWARGASGIPNKDTPEAYISFKYTNSSGDTHSEKSSYIYEKLAWSIPKKRPSIPGVVLYAGVDGSFSSWDPARNYWESERKVKNFDFSPAEVWSGIRKENGNENSGKICNGLIEDWVFWQLENSKEYKQLVSVLDALSPSENEIIQPGAIIKIDGDSTRYPSIRMPYGRDVPLILASAAIKRIASLAYLLVWSWNSHLDASKEIKKAPAREIIFLIDEIECHLHPQWQRRIVPALLRVMQTMGEQVPVQLIITTHSPLVLASAEPEFQESRDSIFSINLKNNKVFVDEIPWAKQGDANNWLNAAFGLKQARSIEAERVIEAAEAFMREDFAILPDDLNTQEKITEAIYKYLPGGDHFLPRWEVFKDI